MHLPIRSTVLALSLVLILLPPSLPERPVGMASSVEADRSMLAFPLFGGGSGGAGPWPSYLFNSEHTGANPAENTIAVGNVSLLQESWTLPSNGSDFSAPIVVGPTLYYGSWNGYEYAIDVATGGVRWSTYLGTDPGCGYSPMGISSTPTYDAGTLYLGGGDGYWYALNATTGQVEWRYFVGAPPTLNNYDWASALVYRNSLYIGVASCFDNPLIRGAVIEVNLTGSHTANHTFYTVPAGQVGVDVWTTPSVDPRNNTLWVSTGNENTGYPPYANALVALNATTLSVLGSWQVPGVQGQDSDFGTTPTLCYSAAGTPLVVATNKNGIAYAFDRANVSTGGGWGPIWSLGTGGGFSSGAFDGRTLYLAGNGVYAVVPSNGTVLWQNSNVTGVYSPLTWANGIVYAGSGSTIDALDARTGRLVWSSIVPGGGTVEAESVVANGALYVPSGNYGAEGNLTAYILPFGGDATASPTAGTAPLSLHVAATGTGGLLPYHFEWGFGDGTFASGANQVHTYVAGGNYTVSAWINDSAAGALVRTFAIHVTPAFTASINVTYLNLSSGCPGSPENPPGPPQVRLTANTSGGVPPILDHWTFSDGGSAVGPVVTRNFTHPFTANLTATDSTGRSANASYLVHAPVVPGACLNPIGPGFWIDLIAIAVIVSAAVALVLFIDRSRRGRAVEEHSRPGP